MHNWLLKVNLNKGFPNFMDAFIFCVSTLYMSYYCREVCVQIQVIQFSYYFNYSKLICGEYTDTQTGWGSRKATSGK
jgi:hypothetical protein